MPTIFAASPGASNVNVAPGQVQTLSPGSYGALADNGIVFLNPGTYSFTSISLGNSAQLQALAGGSTAILVAQTLATGTGAQVSPLGLANALTISVAGTDGVNGSPPAVSIGANTRIVSILAAPNGSIALGSNVNATGAYASLNFAAGSGVALTYQSGFANALPSLSTFVAYAQVSLALGAGDRSLGGDIGVGATSASSAAQLSVGSQAVLDPTRTLYAASLTLGSQAIAGDIDTNALTNGGGQYGTLEPFPSLDMPLLPLAPTAAAGTNAVTVGVGQQQTLSPGSFGALTDDGVVLLQPGTYAFSSVTLGSNAQLQALPGGTTTVAVSGSLVTGAFAQIFPVGQLAGALAISVTGNGSPGAPAATVGANTSIVSVVNVPHGTLSLGNGTQATGAFAASSLIAGTGVGFTYQSGLPSTPPPAAAIQQLSGYYIGTPMSTAPVVGPVPQSTVLSLAVGLPVQSLSALQAFVENVSNPASSAYGQYVPPQNFPAMFGLTSTAYGNVQTWATGQGLTVSSTFPNYMVLGLSGTAGAIEQALNVNLNYALRPDGSVFYTLDREPAVTLPAQQATILYVEGLQNYYPPNPGLSTFSSCNGCLLGNDFRDAYACTNLYGANQSIGLFSAPGTHFYAADFEQYVAAAGNSALTPPVRAVGVDGAQTSPFTYTGAAFQGQVACVGSWSIGCGTSTTTCSPGCQSGQVCQNGTCGCPTGESTCNSKCVDLAADPSNCGACSNACGSGLSCLGGQCSSTCPKPNSACGQECVNEQTDPLHCGSCGKVCPFGATCSAGQCKCSQGGNPAMCNGICTDLASDPMNCGGCRGESTSVTSSVATYTNVCQGSTPACSAGQCLPVCPSGETSCGGGSSSIFSPGIGTSCPSGTTTCESVCCPSGVQCGNGTNCAKGTCCEATNPTLEASLDIEVASAMAPAAQIYLFEGTTYDATVAAMVNYSPGPTPLINQLSLSYTFTADPVMQQLIYQAAAQGQSVFVSSGDSGGTQTVTAGIGSGIILDDRAMEGLTVVGGTHLNVNTTAPESYASETAWPSSTGIILNDVSTPAYQRAAMAESPDPQESTSFRNVPDVSMPADNTAVFAYGGGGGPISVSGTSVSSPLWAGYMALVNGQAASLAKPTAGFINPAVYAIGSTFYGQGGVSSAADCNTKQTAAAGSLYYNDFHDVDDCSRNTPGGASYANACTVPAGGGIATGANCGFTTLPGYDLVTGWGSPTCQLTNDLACATTCGCKVGGSVTACKCIDLNTDANNCGSCLHSCQLGAACVAGVCQPLVLASGLGFLTDMATDGVNVYVSTQSATILSIPIVTATVGVQPFTTIANLSNGSSQINAINIGVDPTLNADDSNLVFFTEAGASLGSANYVTGVFDTTKTGNDIGAFGTTGVVAGPITDFASEPFAPFGGNLFFLQQLNPMNSTPIGVFSLQGPGFGNEVQLGTAQQPTWVAADANNVYWTDCVLSNGTSGVCDSVLFQAPVGGGTQITLAKTNNGSSALIGYGISVDANNVYWAESSANTAAQTTTWIRKVPIGGGTAGTLVSSLPAATTNVVTDGTYVYYGSQSAIWKIPVGGGQPSIYVGIPTSQSVNKLAIDSTNIYWIDATAGIVSQYPRL
jgi:hypothetical protein